MPKCDVCGNDYDKTFQASCAHCGCRIIRHGAENDGKIYCCAF